MKNRLLLFMMLCLFQVTASAQSKIELNLGSGVKAQFTPPSGWNKGSGYGDEYCYNKPGNDARICVSTSWRRNRSHEQILADHLSGLSPIKCEQKESRTNVSYTLWKECQVAVGPRTEGRIWMVMTYNETDNAILIDVDLQRYDAELQKILLQSIESIKVNEPQTQK